MGTRFALAIPALLAACASHATGPSATDWMDYPSPVSSTRINAVHGPSRPNGGAVDVNRLWAVGDNGIILKLDRGSSSLWIEVASPTTVSLYDVYITPDGNGWAVGGYGTILRLNGGTWSCYACPGNGTGCTSGLACNSAPPLQVCSPLYAIIPVDKTSSTAGLFVTGGAGCTPPTCDSGLSGEDYPTILYWDGMTWTRLTTGTFITIPSSVVAVNCGGNDAYTGFMQGASSGVIFESSNMRRHMDFTSTVWDYVSTTIPTNCTGPPYPAYYSSGKLGNFTLLAGDSDNCINDYPNTASVYPETNLFFYPSTPSANSVLRIDTGISSDTTLRGTIRGMDFLPLWGYGIGVGWGDSSGALYNQTRDNAYFAHLSFLDSSRLPAPEDPGSPNRVRYWQDSGRSRLNDVFITNYNEAWAVGDDGTILHWEGPPVAPAVLTAKLTVSMTGMLANMVLTVTNTGGTSALNVTPAMTSVVPLAQAILLSGPTPASVATLPPGGPVHFTWTYSLTGCSAITFNAAANGTDLLTFLPLTASWALAVPPPIAAALSVTAGQVGTNVYFCQLVMTVTNTGTLSATGFIPSDSMSTVPPGAVKLSGPSPSDYYGPLAPGGSTAFTWTYSVTGTPPFTFGGYVTATQDGTGYPLQACASGTSGTIIKPLSSNLVVYTFQKDLNTYHFRLVLTVTNNGSEATGTITPTVTSVPTGAVYVSGPTSSSFGPLSPGQSSIYYWVYELSGGSTGTFQAAASTTIPSSGMPASTSSSASAGPLLKPLSSSLNIETYELGPSNYYYIVKLKVTNVGLTSPLFTEAVGTFTPASNPPAPAGAVKVSGPVPSSISSLPILSSYTFVWSYTLTGSMAQTFYGTASGSFSTSSPVPAAPAFASAYATASGLTNPLEGALSITPRKVSAGLADRWELEVVLTVTNSGSLSATGFTPDSYLVASPSQGIYKMSGPDPEWSWTLPGGAAYFFTWIYDAGGSMNLTMSGGTRAVVMTQLGTQANVYVTATKTIALEDEGPVGLILVDRNIFKSSTQKVNITFNVKDGGKASLAVYNSIGQKIRELGSGEFQNYADPRKDYKLEWDGTNSQGERVSSGVYFIRLEGKRYAVTKKVALVK